MKTYVDLTEPLIATHWRYQSFFQERQLKNMGAERTVRFMNVGHAFTHIDAPRHMVRSGMLLDECNLFSFLIGKATILDVSSVQSNEAITGDYLRKACEGCRMHDVLIIRTCWGTKRTSDMREFWTEAPYLTRDAVEFIRKLHPKAVGFDFPQDYGIRCSDLDSDLAQRNPNSANAPIIEAPSKPTPENSPTHYFLLPYDILMIEYLTNLWSVPDAVNDVDLYALPLKQRTETADGSPIRVIVSF